MGRDRTVRLSPRAYSTTQVDSVFQLKLFDLWLLFNSDVHDNKIADVLLHEHLNYLAIPLFKLFINVSVKSKITCPQDKWARKNCLVSSPNTDL